MTQSNDTRNSAGKGAKKVSAVRPFLEIQYHPGDIRKGVRYLFLSRRRVVWSLLGLTAWGLFVMASLWMIPSLVGKWLATWEYAELVERRAVLGDELERWVVDLEAVAERSESLRREMDQIHLAYGFPESEALGKGGYPHEPAPVPSSIFAAEIRRGNGLEARVSEQLGALEALFEEVQSFEQLHQDQVRTTPSLSPLRSEDFVLTSPYGMRTSPFTKERDFHAGIDLAAAAGTPIYAPSDGEVVFAGRYSLKRSVAWWRYGNLVAIRHGDRFITLYGHCEETHVRNGQKVRQGELLGTVGNTGWSTNPHLHYEIRRIEDDGEWVPVDPRIYILDHRWRDEERLLISARQSPQPKGFEPLPTLIRR